MKRVILHLTGMHSLKYGGVERYLLELAKSSARHGYRTIIQYESYPRSTAYVQELTDAGCELVILETGSSVMKSTLSVVGLIRSIKPEIIQTHFVRGYIYILLPLLARLVGTRKLLALIHSVQDNRRAWRRFALNHFDHVIGVSRGVAASLLAIKTKPEIVSHHYLGLFGERTRSQNERETFRLALGIPREAVVIACIAFDSQIKGVDILLAAFANISEQFPLTHLLSIGVDPLQSDLPAVAKQLGIGQRTHWAGLRDEGWKLLNAADLYVQPSRSEAMPFAVMEAMSLSLPVIATRVGGLPEIVVDNETGYLVAPTPLALAEVLRATLRRQQEWKTLGEAAFLRYRTHFKGESSVQAFVETYY